MTDPNTDYALALLEALAAALAAMETLKEET